MNGHEPDDDLAPGEQSLLVDVVTGDVAAGDERVRAACAANPAFAARLQQAREVVDRLAAWRLAEDASLAAPGSPLEAIAVAATRRGLAARVEAVRGARVGPRRWPWLLLLAAALLVTVSWPSADGDPASRERIYLGTGIEFRIDVETRTLHFMEPPPPTASYLVEFGRGPGRDPITSVGDITAGSLVLPDLGPYRPLEWLRVVLMEDGEQKRDSGFVPLPASLGR